MAVEGILLILAGLFSLAGAVFDWEWFMNSRRARFFTGIFGRDGARIFYGGLGLVIVLAGIYVMVGGD